MEKFYLQIGVRIPNVDLKENFTFNEVVETLFDPGFKSNFVKYSESTAFSFKIVSNVDIPNLSFLRFLLEKCLKVNIDDLSLVIIDKKTFLEEKNHNEDDNSHSDELTECISTVLSYQKKLKNKSIKNFDYKKFKDAGDIFIEQLIVANTSPKVQLTESDFVYFSYNQNGSTVKFKHISLDEVKKENLDG